MEGRHAPASAPDGPGRPPGPRRADGAHRGGRHRLAPSLRRAMSAPASSSRPRPGTDLELVVDRLAYGGKGVARLSTQTASPSGTGGYVVFVAGGLPGDRVLARVERSKRAYA